MDEPPPWGDEDAPPTNILPFVPPKKERKSKLASRWVSGSETEIARQGMRDLGECMSHSGLLWILQPDNTWRPMDLGPEATEHQATWMRHIAQYDGEPVGERPLRIGKSAARGSWEMALALCAQPMEVIPVGCATETGFVTLRDGHIHQRPLRPEDRQSDVWRVSYTQSDTAPTWDDCCAKWWPGCHQERQEFLEAYTGLCILGRSTDYERAILIKGPEGNGKSILVHALTSFFPPGVVSAVTPDKFVDDQKLIALRGSRLNYCSELNDHAQIPGDLFKSVVSGESIQIRQIYRSAFMTRMVAGHIYASNPWPRVHHDKGSRARWCVVMMDQHFRGERWETPKPALMDRLSAEASAIFSRCIRAGAAVLRGGQWLEPEWSRQAKDEWTEHGDSVAAFVAERLDVIKSRGAGVNAVYRVYSEWCKDAGMPPKGRNNFVQTMDQLGIGRVRGSTSNHFRAVFKPFVT